VRPYTPFPRGGRGEPHADLFGVLKRSFSKAEASLPHSIVPFARLAGGTRSRAHRRAPLHPSPTLWEKGWG